jgi:cobalt-zinc-cadmium efflux system protein
VTTHTPHSHDHAHAHAHGADSRRLGWALAVTAGFMGIEVVGGWLAGSLALIADAGHMLTDTAALLLAWIAARLAEQPAEPGRTYGYHRAQVLAAFVNAIALFVVVAWIAYEAAHRLAEPRPVAGGTMLGIALAGLVANLAVYFMLGHRDHDPGATNLNVSAARLHVFGDLLGSIGAALAAVVILATGWTPIDPILSILMAVLIVRGAWRLLRESTHILMENTPEHVDLGALRSTLMTSVPGIRDVHDVHCWSLTTGQTMLSLHLALGGGADSTLVLREAKRVLAENFSVAHSALQIELGDCPDETCRL